MHANPPRLIGLGQYAQERLQRRPWVWCACALVFGWLIADSIAQDGAGRVSHGPAKSSTGRHEQPVSLPNWRSLVTEVETAHEIET